ncbi:heme biosynthesis operon protein HemX [Alteromonas sp. 345S023]|uniref:Heme biosynthesis operon protein HemX n=1 Tax=Alteromonas profundi TaxID=2696062 RepID=A0A7X5RKB2_9ALTE|nr:uroporphyrinogen-III C-methyltransferase [Alteromonas profundi]NDV90449.1 heme biosynthesis operon protein HemX [Alteromonas profundi]
MADHNDKDPLEGEVISVEPESQSTSAEEPSHSQTKPKEAKKSKGKGTGLLWFVVIVLFLLIIGVIGAGYWYYTQQQSNSEAFVSQQQQTTSTIESLSNERSELNAELSRLASTNKQLESTIKQLDTAYEELQQKNTALAQQSQATVEQLNNMKGRRPADWLIAEADYLVRMAGRKLWLEQDVRTAILLLVNADKRLQSLADPSVVPVRASLAEDIQTLQQLNPVSPTSVALAITGMLAQIDKLPLNTFEKPIDTDVKSTELSESPDDWKENLSKVWNSIVDGFLSVKTIEGPIEPVMSLEAQFLAKEQLRLQLMHAQSAALQGEKGFYEQTLKYAIELLGNNFDSESAPVKGFTQALENLLETDISRPIPSELTSQKPLERLLDTRVKQAFGQGASAL